MLKRTCLIIMLIAIYVQASAQKYVPVIKNGTVLSYSAFSKALGQSIPLTLTMTSTAAPVKMQWNVEGYGSGGFEITAKAIESAKKIAIKQPEPDGVTRFKDDETLVVVSKTMFADMVNNKTFELNGKVFNVLQDTTAFKINDKEADVFYAETANGKGKIWILNNPDFPIVCKSVGSIPGIDIALTSVTE